MKKNTIKKFVAIFGLIVSLLTLFNLTTISLESRISTNPELLSSLLLIFFGLLLRGLRSHLIFESLYKSKFNIQVIGLSLSYTFSFFLPYRLGEVFRIAYLKYRGKFSLGLTLSVIIIERGFDLAFISLIILFLSMNSVNEEYVSLLDSFTFPIFVGALTFAILLFLILRVPLLLKLILWISGLLNNGYSLKIRNSAWRTIMNINYIFGNSRLMILYTLLFILSWSFIIVGIALILSMDWLSSGEELSSGIFALSVTAAVVSNSLNLADYTDAITLLYGDLLKSKLVDFDLSIINLWFVSNFPIVFLGSLALFIISLKIFSERVIEIPKSTLMNDLSSSPEFLKSFFENEPLVARFYASVQGRKIDILGYFRGGSRAITMLTQEGERIEVTKVVEQTHSNKLRGQVAWLEKHYQKGRTVRVTGSIDNEYFFGFKMEYVTPSISFFEFIHCNTLKENARILQLVWNFLGSDIYRQINVQTESGLDSSLAYQEKNLRASSYHSTTSPIAFGALISFEEYLSSRRKFLYETGSNGGKRKEVIHKNKARERGGGERYLESFKEVKAITHPMKTYIQTNLHGKLLECMQSSTLFADFFHPEKRTIINGEEILSLEEILSAINSKRQIIECLSNYRSTESCHGDLTIENILVKQSLRGKVFMPVIIDPSDDNIVSGPLVDAGRLGQSLFGGYEFLIRASDSVDVKSNGSETIINFQDFRSSQYSELGHYFRNELAPKIMTNEEVRATLFHAGLFMIRTLPHRLRIDSKTSLKYYASGMRLMSRFVLDEY